MANLSEISEWAAGVRQLETTDPLLGGAGGILNTAPQQLNNRINFLRTLIESHGIAQAVNFTGNLNNLQESGFYYANTGHTNSPPGIVGGHVYVSSLSTITSQLYVATSPASGGVWYRVKRFGQSAFDAWVRLAGAAEVTALQQIINSHGIPNAVSYTGNLDALQESGFYIANTGHTGSPQGFGGHVYVSALGGVVSQLFVTTQSTATGVFYRVLRFGTNVWDAWRKIAEQDETAAAISAAFDPFVGSISVFPATNVPAGWLECNGAVISRTAYAKLFAFANSSGAMTPPGPQPFDPGKFLPGDGSTTFGLPDLRGYFVRGWDHGKGVDPGRVIGSLQQDAMQTHVHPFGLDVHRDGGTGPGLETGDGTQWDTLNMSTGANSGGASETRPVNVSMMYCIKY